MNLRIIEQKFISVFVISVTILSFCFQMITSSTTFVASFQNKGGWSTREWMEFNQPIPTLQEFTACHWEKVRFMTSDIISIWAYCIAERKQLTNMNCTQLYTKRAPESNYRQITFMADVNGEQVSTSFNLDHYQHRTWNHICWTYSSIKKMSRLYHNGRLIANKPLTEAPIIPSENDFKVTSIILGQEPDSFNGNFSMTQLFNGELSEMNLWDSVLSDEEIASVGKCQKEVTGNVLAWKREWFKNHNVHIKSNFESHSFCKKEKKYVVFPKRVSLHIAKTFCQAHGGHLAAPQTSDENKEVMNILNQHKMICNENDPENPDNFGKVAWLGFEKQNSEMYIMNSKAQKDNLRFSNWKFPEHVNKRRYDSACTYANSEGQWVIVTKDACDYLQLCAICVMEVNPVMNLNGLCIQAHFDFNYYIATNNKHTIDYYEGYKISNIIKINGSWIFVSKSRKKIDASIIKNVEGRDEDVSLIGRMDWNVYEPSCGITSIEKKKISLSKCIFSKQFTCDSGTCVDIKDRCNMINDCSDHSDEQNCELVVFPDNYSGVEPPKTMNTSEALEVISSIKIESIDFIDTIKMHVGLTFEINQKWNDSRLTYANLNNNGTNRVKPSTRKKMWIPFNHITVVNALLGEIYADDSEEMEIQALSPPLQMKPDYAMQNTLYEGAKTTIVFQKRLGIRFKCTFELRYFPFDKQSCTFTLKMAYNRYNAAVLKKDEAGIIYVGSKTTKGFKIVEAFAGTNITRRHSYFNFNVNLERVYTDQLIAAFFPTVLLWFLAYFTLFIDNENFSDRIMVSTTVLLVLAALLDSIKDDIPSTFEFKYIDLWFLWYTSFIFVIALFHILLHQMSNKVKKNKISVNGQQIGIHEETTATRKKNLNDIAKVLMMILFVSFNVAYFLFQSLM